MHSPELAKIAVVMMECDVLGALGEVQRYLPKAAYARLHAAVYTLAQTALLPSREGEAVNSDDSAPKEPS